MTVGPAYIEGHPADEQRNLASLVQRRIPTVIVTSGGYTRRSHQLIAELALAVAGLPTAPGA